MKKEKIKKALIIIAAIVVSAVIIAGGTLVVLGLPWMLISCSIMNQPDPAQPEITYAEFPVTIVFEKDGETITYNDAIICEYDGVKMDEGRGKYRAWSSRYASGERLKICKLDDGRYVTCYKQYDPGKLMGDNEYPTYPYMQEKAWYTVSIVKETESGYEREDLTTGELLDEYGVDIISFKMAPPIKNTFV